MDQNQPNQPVPIMPSIPEKDPFADQTPADNHKTSKNKLFLIYVIVSGLLLLTIISLSIYFATNDSGQEAEQSNSSLETQEEPEPKTIAEFLEMYEQKDLGIKVAYSKVQDSFPALNANNNPDFIPATRHRLTTPDYQDGVKANETLKQKVAKDFSDFLKEAGYAQQKSGLQVGEEQSCLADNISYADTILNTVCFKNSDLEAIKTKTNSQFMQSLYKAYPPNQGQDNFYVLIQDSTEENIKTIADYQLLETSADNFELVDGLLYYSPSGWRVSFYRQTGQEDWKAFSLGQSALPCEDFNDLAKQTVFADESCWSSDTNSTTVGEYYKN